MKNTDLYWLAFPNDRMHLKCLVYGIYILEFAQSVLTIKVGFWIFVTGFGDVGALESSNTLWSSVPILTAIGELAYCLHRACAAGILISHPDTFLVQGYYAHRIRIMGQSNKLAGAIFFVSHRKSLIVFKI
jgi:hypothetical protein